MSECSEWDGITYERENEICLWDNLWRATHVLRDGMIWMIRGCNEMATDHGWYFL